MYAIQNGPNWWVDSVARFPVGQMQGRGRIGAMSEFTRSNVSDVYASSQPVNLDTWKLIGPDAGSKDGWSQSMNDALASQMLQNPAAALSASSSDGNRMNAYALLSA